MLDTGFMAKATTLKPRPSLLYLGVQVSGRNVSWVDREETHSFMNPKFTRKVGLAGA